MPDYPSGKRQFLADFVGTLSGDISRDIRPDALCFGYKQAFTFGPYGIGDSSQGPLNRAWYARTEGNNVFMARQSEDMQSWEAETLLFSFVGVEITELDVAFEQLGRPVIVAERPTGTAGAPELWVYWFDPILNAFTFENFGDGRTPRAILDYTPDTSISDVLVFYFKSDQGLVFRQQRDRYDTIYTTPVTDATDRYLEEVAFLDNWRITAYHTRRQVDGTYLMSRLQTTMYPLLQISEQNITFASGVASGFLGEALFIVGPVSGDIIGATHWHDEGKLAFASDIRSESRMYDPIIPVLLTPSELGYLTDVTAGSLVVVVIEDTLDEEELEFLSDVFSGSLVVVIIEHTLFDKDSLEFSSDITSGSLVAA